MSRPLSFSSFFNIIDGGLSSTKQTRHSINPSTLEPNPEVPVSTLEDVDRAVNAARKAFVSWTEVPIEERRRALLAFADALGQHAKEFAEMLTKEQGRPLLLSQVEVAASLSRLQATATLDLPETVIEETDDRIILQRYTPLGVTCGIVPWNFPINLACAKLAAALITGNCFIMKPSPFTPYCGLKLCELAQQFFPPGVIQCLSGDDDLGPWLTGHPGIDKVSFTGSTETGKLVMETCSRTLKRITLELGGNDPAIVYPDVDVVKVATSIAQVCLFNSSQVCLTIKRIYVHADIYPQFLEAFSSAVKSFKVGDGFAHGVLMGPIQNEPQFNRIRELVSDARNKNLKIVSDTCHAGGAGRGFFIQPVIVDNPPDSSRVVQEEPFGPVLPLLTWSDEDDVISRANDTRYGLGASVWTANLERGADVAKRLEAGTVWINNHMDLSPLAPVGGYKDSGIGVEGGAAGLLAYCNSQVLYIPKQK